MLSWVVGFTYVFYLSARYHKVTCGTAISGYSMITPICSLADDFGCQTKKKKPVAIANRGFAFLLARSIVGRATSGHSFEEAEGASSFIGCPNGAARRRPSMKVNKYAENWRGQQLVIRMSFC